VRKQSAFACDFSAHFDRLVFPASDLVSAAMNEVAAEEEKGGKAELNAVGEEQQT
jgi:hypothetical protein